MKRKTILLLSLLITTMVMGQVNVTMKMDTNQIFIGEQVLLKLKVSAGSNDIVIVP